jgi:hypothetical protein
MESVRKLCEIILPITMQTGCAWLLVTVIGCESVRRYPLYPGDLNRLPQHFILNAKMEYMIMVPNYCRGFIPKVNNRPYAHL